MVPLLFGSLAVMLLGATPIFLALGLSTLLALIFASPLPPAIMVQRLFGGIDKFALMSMPFFILAANIMGAGGIADRILKWVQLFTGRMRGGAALTTELACMFFGALSGSSPATVAAIGGIMYPELKRDKYGEGFSIGLIAASGSVALIIPPSLTLIVYGAATGTSVGALFIGGIGAGIIYGLAFLIYCYLYAVKHDLPRGEKSSFREIIQVTKEAIWALGIPIIILGGIYAGVFTPTEAAGVSVVYAIFVSMFIYKELTWKQLLAICLSSAQTIAEVMVLVACASAFGWLITMGEIPQKLASSILSFGSSPAMFLFIVNVILLIAGMFIDGTAAITILVPLIYPLAVKLGINPVHLGVITIANLAIGMFTPPFGLNLFVGSQACEVSVVKVIQGVMPFIAISLIALILITYIPSISLFLPRMVYGGV
ncbi:MAG: TRAP transporter large permease subunit [Firmicutes bacterium]|jgi:C4-dicarboxylate transporter DctM subunit|nr:TRAP transporter large permease subunit [Bacillota bacterium]